MIPMSLLVHQFLERSAARRPDKTALVCGPIRLSYAQVDQLAGRIAWRLAAVGVRRQDRVIIVLENSVESVAAIFGVLKAGATFIVLNPAIKKAKLTYILDNADACAVVTHRRRETVVAPAVAAAARPPQVLWFATAPGLHGLEGSLLGANDALPAPWALAPGRSQASGAPATCIDVDIATIIYTSGSTGSPKGVVSAHYNVVAAVRSITTYLENVADDIILNVLPLSFDYGLYQLLMAFKVGGTLVLEPSFAYPIQTLATLARERVTGFPIVPTMVALLLQIGDLSRFDLRALRYVTNTAAVLPPSHIRRLRALWPHVKLYSMYGLTECKRVSYLPPAYVDTKPESVGIAIPNEEVFVVDENGCELGPGQVGELVVRGQNVMQGYWNDPEETVRVFRPGRYRGEVYLHTGDLFRKDEDGFLYFVARKDDLLKIKGERVAPREIEAVLLEMEEIAEAAVIGVSDPIWGQTVKAFVVRKTSRDLSPSAIQKHCRKHLEPFLVPKTITFVERLPKSANGKIDRKALA